VVARFRGIRFYEACPGLWTPILEHQITAQHILREVANAFGYDTTSEYLDALAKEGPDILKRLPGVTVDTRPPSDANHGEHTT
jgi:hypothetical protein